jgi:hypothetical protein
MAYVRVTSFAWEGGYALQKSGESFAAMLHRGHPMNGGGVYGFPVRAGAYAHAHEH